MTKVKICGLSRMCDIDTVNKEHPDYVGFVFAASPRRVTFETASELRERLRSDITAVGVFVDEAIENIISLIDGDVIDAVQLHGSETESYIEELKAMTDVPMIRSVTVRNADDIEKQMTSKADFLLLDGGCGGAGTRFDLRFAENVGKQFFLAGGLSPDNVVDAVRRTRPFAVDVSSGVETDGKKDPKKIEEFIRRVRNG